MEYILRVGKDGVKGVMQRYNVTLDDIARWNGIKPSEYREGMLMTINIDDDIRHVVMPFESVEGIARRYNVSPDEIRKYNDIDKVFVGDIIYIERK